MTVGMNFHYWAVAVGNVSRLYHATTVYDYTMQLQSMEEE